MCCGDGKHKTKRNRIFQTMRMTLPLTFIIYESSGKHACLLTTSAQQTNTSQDPRVVHRKTEEALVMPQPKGLCMCDSPTVGTGGACRAKTLSMDSLSCVARDRMSRGKTLKS
eukprot:scaffold40967_cov33-Prasinocladus_malaysianus.AAC.2